ncbi:leucine zipper-like transcriptional regulator [Cystoisospora suis]|uniref:Leucine zipper-like transcriptional regulator n=1 Tax=Cystoisospora suis TaxID=483139 RepID=A0A2C6L3J2_9APIC|nr:leucine zipper-like transcriptional regulator [Cystoisospora suis]
MYVFGGTTPGCWLQDTHAFDFEKGTWQELQTGGEAKPSARSGFVCAVCKTDGVFYVFGGVNHDGVRKDMYELNLHTLEWRETIQQGSVPCGREGSSWTQHQDKIYMFGGHDGVSCLRDFCFTIPTRCWTSVAVQSCPTSLPSGSSSSLTFYSVESTGSGPQQSEMGSSASGQDFFSASIEGDHCSAHRSVVGTPRTGGTEKQRRTAAGRRKKAQSSLLGDTAMRSVTSAAAEAPPPRYYHAAVAHRNCIYFFGGLGRQGEAEALDDFYVFNLDTNQWHAVENNDTPSGRGRMVAQVYKNTLYILGGNNGKKVLDGFYEFSVERTPVPPSKLEADLGGLLGPSGGDVTFVVDGGKLLYGSKGVLIARNDYFRAMFARGLKETEMVERGLPIKIEGVQFEIMAALLQYLHTDVVCESLSWQEVLQLMITAERFCADRLKWLCAENLRQMLTPGNVATVLSVADTHRMRNLKLTCFEFILEHEEQMKESELSVLTGHPSVLLELYMRSRSEKFQ